MQESNDSLVPLPVVWQKPGREIYVTGDFNDFSLLPLNGETEKFAIIWVKPGKVLYRFRVDGIYMIDPNKPIKLLDGAEFNLIEVSKLPHAISDIQTLSLRELKDLDMNLCQGSKRDQPNAEIKNRFASSLFPPKGSPLPSKNKFGNKSLNKIIKIQAFIRGKLQHMKFKKILEKTKIIKNFKDSSTNTEQNIVIDLEKEKLKLQIEKLKKENEMLLKVAQKWKYKYESVKERQEKPIDNIKVRSPKKNLTMPSIPWVKSTTPDSKSQNPINIREFPKTQSISSKRIIKW
ncbi:unnamed protein product [Blepharisma stoltei]|uniref:AMP-activated protein kinase glycogen-binding domain-containing protein n=1 Tax=Blepharisma stoltei TaxID=1481888 RepID=A0AAU9ITL7_9CILI|nr:unnamed protein product [Blepharisma stoltei]